MSLGLLGGYGSDSASGSEISDSDGEATHSEVVEPASDCAGSESRDPSCTQRHDVEHPAAAGGEEEGESACNQPQSLSYYGLGMSDSLLGCVDSDSSSKSVDEGEEEGEGSADEYRDHSPLPLPDLDGSKKIVSSVFSNPYMEAEEAKLAVLKQHVDLSHNQETKQDRRRRPKWSKRGKCHSSHGASFDESSPLGGRGEQWFDEKDSSRGPERGRKHRSGLTETLMPPKKFMKSHQKMQSHERPWTAR